MSDRGNLAARLAALAPVFAIAVLTGGTLSASAAVTCDRVAAPSGSDSSPGTAGEPFKTAQKLADSLTAGQTGCLRGGTYTEDIKVSQSGTATAPVTIRSYPGERATLVGRLWIAEGSDYVTFSNLNIDGTNETDLPSPTVNADHITFQDNDITTNHTMICILLGSMRGKADYAVITRNRIHDCGRLPAGNHDHGIYIALSTGSTISYNLIYDNADRGIQFYPNAQQTYIHHNIIDGNGQGIIFGGHDGVASNDNLVERNIITNSIIRHNVESYYDPGQPIGTGNVVRENCVHGGARDNGLNGGIQEPQVGFTAFDNLLVDPLYVNRAAKDFRLLSSSPCLPLTGDIAAVLDGGEGSDPPADPDPGSDTDPDPGTNPAPDPDPGPDTDPDTDPYPSSKPERRDRRRVILRVLRKRVHSGQWLRLRGRVLFAEHRRSRRAVVQVRDRGRWHLLKRATLTRHDRFATKLKVRKNRRWRRLVRPHAARSGCSAIKLRARVPHVGRSAPVRVRICA